MTPEEKDIYNILNNKNDKKALLKLKKYKTKYNIDFSRITKPLTFCILEKNFNIIIIAIEVNVSIDIFEYIIEQCNYSNIFDDYEKYEYLLFTINLNLFNKADILLKNGANLNYNNGIIIKDLYEKKQLNEQKLNYILNNGINISGINLFLKSWGEQEFYYKKDTKYFDIICNHYCNKKNIKNKIKILDNYYNKAYHNKDYYLFKGLFNLDKNNKEIIIDRISRCEILYKALYFKLNKCDILNSEDYLKFINCILSFNALKLEDLISKHMLLLLKNINDDDITNLIIDKSLITITKRVDKAEQKCLFYINQILTLAISIEYFYLIGYMIKCDNYIKYINSENKSNIKTEILNYTDKKGLTPLHHAIDMGSITIIKQLIENGADVDFVQEKTEVSILIYAIGKKNIDIIKILIEYGADVNYVQKKSQRSILMYMIKEKYVPIYESEYINIFKYLIKFGANINYVQKINQKSVLMYAIELKRRHYISLLIKYGADVNFVQEINQKSLLMYTIDLNDYSNFELLVNNGANVDYIPKNNGKSILMYLIDLCDDDTIDDEIDNYTCNNDENSDLYDSDTTVNNPLLNRLALNLNNFDILKYQFIDLLIKYGANINYVQENNKISVLMYAIDQEKYNVAKHLLRYSKDVNICYKNPDGRSAVTTLIENYINNFIIIDDMKINLENYNCKSQSIVEKVHTKLSNISNSYLNDDEKVHTQLFNNHEIKKKSCCNNYLNEILSKEYKKNKILSSKASLLQKSSLFNYKDKPLLSTIIEKWELKNKEILNMLSWLVKYNSKNIDATKFYIDEGILQQIIFNDQLDLLKIFVENKLNLNYKDKKGNTILNYAMDVGNDEIIGYLLEQPAMNNSKTYNFQKFKIKNKTNEINEQNDFKNNLLMVKDCIFVIGNIVKQYLNKYLITMNDYISTYSNYTLALLIIYTVIIIVLIIY